MPDERKIISAADALSNSARKVDGLVRNIDRISARAPETIGNQYEDFNTYDAGIPVGFNQQEYRGQQQTGWQALRNSIPQLVTGTLGEIISTPGYFLSAFDDFDEAEQGVSGFFLEAGEAVSGFGQDVFPVHLSDQEQSQVFNPFSGKWWANTTVNFGPTLALMATGLGTGALTTKLSTSALKQANKSLLKKQLKKLGRNVAEEELDKAATALAQQSNFLRKGNTAVSAAASRSVESMMEANESYKNTLAELERLYPNMSEEERKEKAGDAASKVYVANWALGLVDFFEYDMLGKLFQNGFKKSALNLTKQMSAEALEEGLQYTFSQTNEAEALGRPTDGYVQDFFNNLSETEMQQAMVQGALGGGVFAGLGQAFKKKIDKTKDTVKKVQDATTEADVRKVATEAAVENDLSKNTPLKIEDTETKPKSKEEETSTEEMDAAVNIFNKAKAQHENKGENSTVATELAKQDTIAKSQFDHIKNKEKELNEVLTDLATIVPDSTSREYKVAKLKLKQAKKTKRDDLIKKYEEQVKQFENVEEGQEKPKNPATAIDDRLEALIEEQITAEKNIAETGDKKKDIKKAKQSIIDKAIKEEEQRQREVEKQKEQAALKAVDDPVKLKELYNESAGTDKSKVKDEIKRRAEAEQKGFDLNTLDQEQYEQFLEENPYSKVLDEITPKVTPKQTSNKTPEANKPTAVTSEGDQWIETYDFAQFEFQGSTVRYIRTSGGIETLDVFSEKFFPYENMEEGKVYTLRYATGDPVPSEYAEEVGINLDYLREGNVQVGDEVTFEVDESFDTVSNWNIHPESNYMNFYVHIKHNGNIIGVLRAFKDGRSKKLELLRKQLYKAYKNNQDVLGTTTIKTLGSGEFWHTGNRIGLMEAKPSDLPLVLMVKTNVEGITSGYELNSESLREKYDLNDVVDVNSTNDGAVFMLTQALDGTYLPARVFTKTANQVPALKEKLLEAINERNMQETRSIVRYKKDGKLEPNFNDKIVEMYGSNLVPKFFSKKGEELKNKNGTTYKAIYTQPGTLLVEPNQDYLAKLKEGKVSGTIYRVVGKPDISGASQVDVLNDKLVKIGETKINISNMVSSEMLYQHFAWRYADQNDLFTRPLQIDPKKINKGSYNESVLDRLETNLNPKQNFHSPTFEVELSTTPASTSNVAETQEVSKQINKVFERLAEINKEPSSEKKTLKQLNEVSRFRKNIANGAVATQEQIEQIDQIEQEAKNEGYEIVDLVGKKYNVEDKLETDFVADENLPNGLSIIKSVRRPQVNKNGKMVQMASVVVAVGTKPDSVREALVNEEDRAYKSKDIKRLKKARKALKEYDAKFIDKFNRQEAQSSIAQPTTPVTKQEVQANVSETSSQIEEAESAATQKPVTEALEETLSLEGEYTPINRDTIKKKGRKKEYTITIEGKEYTKKGYQVVIPEYPDVDLWVSRTELDGTEGKYWGVDDRRTGMRMGSTWSTMDNTLEFTADYLNQAFERASREDLAKIGFLPKISDKPEQPITDSGLDRSLFDEMLGKVEGDAKFNISEPTQAAVVQPPKTSEATISNLIDEQVTDNELAQVAKEENLESKLQAKQQIKKEVISQMNDKTNKKPKTLLQKVAARIKKLLLNLALVAAVVSNLSFTPVNTGSSLTYDNLKIEQLTSFEDVKLHQDQINKLDNIKIITEYHKDKRGKYIIIDKANGVAHLHERDSLMTSYQVGLGERKGDEQTILSSIYLNNKGQEVSPNEAIVTENGNSYLKPGYYSRTNWNDGNRKTGAGIYTISRKGKYRGELAYFLKNERGISVATALHKATSVTRQRKLNDDNFYNNRFSNGCLNFSLNDLADLQNQGVSKDAKVYILPDNPNNTFELIDGKLRFTSSNPDVNVSLANYVAQPITIKVKDINDTGKDFVQALADSKSAIMKLYPTISNDIYNQVAKLAYGIFGQESSFGTYGKLRGQVGRITDLGQLAANTLLDQNLNPSIGVTQIRFSNVRPEVRSSFDINQASDLLNTAKAAQATMSLLLDIYVNEIPGNLKSEFNTLLPLAYSSKQEFREVINGETIKDNQYVKNVISNANNVNIYLGTNLDESNNQPLTGESDNTLLLGLAALLGTRRKRKQDDAKYAITEQSTDQEELLVDYIEARGIPVNVRDYLINVANTNIKAPGIFTGAVAEIYKNSNNRVLFHEAGHAVFNLALDKKQQDSLLKYYKPDDNLLNKIAQAYSKLTEEEQYRLAQEEMLMDDFADYLYDRVFDKSIKARVRRFFQKLLDLIQYVFTNTYTVNQLVSKFHNNKIKIDLKRNTDTLQARYAINNSIFPINEYYQVVDIVTHELDDIVTNNREDTETYQEAYARLILDKNVDTNILTRKDADGVLGRIMSFYKENQNVLNDEDFVRLVNGIRNGNQFGELYLDILRNLNSRGIYIDIARLESKELTDNEDIVTIQQGDDRENWQVKVNSVSPFEQLGEILRFELNRIKRVKWNADKSDVEEVRGYLQFPQYYTVDEVYKRLQTMLGNSPTIEIFEKRLDYWSVIDPLAFYIKDRFLPTREKEFGLKTLLFNKIGQNVKYDYITHVQNNRNKFTTVMTNSRSEVKYMIADIISGFKQNTKVLNNKGEYDGVEEYAERILQAIKTRDYPTVDRMLYDMGVTPYEGIIEELTDKDRKKLLRGRYGFKHILEGFKQGKDMFGIYGEQTPSSVIRNIAKVYTKYTQPKTNNMHRNPDGGKVFEWNRPNFLSKRLIELTQFYDTTRQYYSDPYYNYSTFLAKLANKEYRDKVRMVVMADMRLKGKSQGVEFSDMSKKELMINMLAQFFNGGSDTGFYIPLPTHSDSSVQTAIFINEDKNHDRIPELLELAKQELYTIVEGQQDKFLLFPELNDKLDSYKKQWENLNEEQLVNDIENIVEQRIASEMKLLKELGIIDENNKFTDSLFNEAPAETLIKQFVPTFMVYQSEFINVFNGNLGHYIDIRTFYKRAKQIWSPVNYLNTDAEYNDIKVRANYNLKILPDNFVTNKTLVKILNGLQPGLGDLYKNVNETDGQSYVDLFRFKEEQVGLGRWDSVKENAYQRLLKGEFNMEEIEEVFNISKPYYFGFHKEGDKYYPFQNKDSQFILFPMFGLQKINGKDNPLYNEEYKKMLEQMGYEFTEDSVTTVKNFEQERAKENSRYVDKFTFESAIKVGKSGIVEAGKYETGKIHKASNSNWGLQMEVPEHHIDERGLMAVQVRKNMINNIDLEAMYEFPTELEFTDNNGETIKRKKVTGKKLVELYNSIQIQDIKEDMESIGKKFESFEKVVEMVRQEVLRRGMGERYEDALQLETIGENKQTRLPLYHPAHIYKIRQLLNSLYTKQVTQQKLTNGVALANLSSYGFKNKPEIIIEDGKVTKIEAYAPIYSDELLEFIGEDGLVHVEDLPEELRRGMVWRIPNEAKYSTYNIEIKAFFPREFGNGIVLPPEITTLAGLD